jgi:hypothetical protein
LGLRFDSDQSITLAQQTPGLSGIPHIAHRRLGDLASIGLQRVHKYTKAVTGSQSVNQRPTATKRTISATAITIKSRQPAIEPLTIDLPCFLRYSGN